MLTNKLKLLSMVLWQMSTVQNIPFKVIITKNEKNKPHFSLQPASKKYLRKLTIKSHLITFILVTLVLQVAHGKSFATGDELGMDEKLLGCAAIIMFTILTSHIHQTRRKGPELMCYLKGVIQLTEQQNTQNEDIPKSFTELPFLELLNMAFVPVALLNGFVFPPFFTIGFHWLNPCKLSLAGHGLLAECHCQALGNTVPVVEMVIRKVVKGGILLGNCWAWFFSVHATILLVTSVEILSMYLIRDGIRSLTISLFDFGLERFWNKLKWSKTPYQSAIIYRQFQLLNILCNTAQKYALGTLIVGSTLIVASSFAVLVRMTAAGKGSMTMMGVLSISTVDAGVALLVVLGGIVGVFSESKQVLEQVKWMDAHDGSNMTIERKWKKRFWRSCTLIKINFGGSNFIEELTPLNCANFAVDLSVQFMLAN